MREIQLVRYGTESIPARDGHTIKIADTKDGYSAIERNDKTGETTKELWLGTGAFIVYKETK